ncbi:MAG: SEC-C metal-binding domain-containing protein [Thermoleophilaceae bacterium]
MTVSRNSACPCGSGREYERCCLAGHERAEKEARFDDAVGRRIQEWSSQVLGEEIADAAWIRDELGVDDELAA